MKPGDLLLALIDDDAFDCFGNKRSIKTGMLYLADQVDTLFGFVRLDGFNGACYSTSSFDVMDICSNSVTVTNSVQYPWGLKSGKALELEGLNKCSHKNKRKSFVMKHGEKETFYYCPDCKEEVLC